MKNTKAIIAILVIAVVVLGTWYFWGGGESVVEHNEEMSQEEAMENTNGSSGGSTSASRPERTFENGHYVTFVYFNGTSFSPATVTIDHGESVRFVNLSDLSMRVGTRVESLSSVKYSTLTQPNPEGKGGEYDIFFNEPGTWAYENIPSSGSARILGTVNIR